MFEKGKTIEILESEDCCGCAACSDKCPKGAITMEVDSKGNLRPSVNSQVCVSCSICVRTCPSLYNPRKDDQAKSFLVAYYKNMEISTYSSSGGIFVALAINAIKSGGVVYGAGMQIDDNMLKCKHIRVTSMDGLRDLQGSKYVQSVTEGIFKQVQEDLDAGRFVIFSGTSCQIAALNKFLRIKYNNLITIDLVCHGVPKISLYNDYISFLEKRSGKKIIGMTFRSKGNRYLGKHDSYVLTINYQKGSTLVKKMIPNQKSSYYSLFINRVGYRDSCYKCKYSSINKYSDLTLGDFKPSKEEIQSFGLNPDITYSSVIIHTGNGHAFFERLRNEIETISISQELMIKHHANLQRPSVPTSNGLNLYNIYRRGGYKSLQRKIDIISFRHALIYNIKSSLILLDKLFCR